MIQKTDTPTPVLLGDYTKTETQQYDWGNKATFFNDWGWDNFLVNGHLVEFVQKTIYSVWADPSAENLCIVEDGEGTISFNNKDYKLAKDHVFKVFPGQAPIIQPTNSLKIFSLQLPKANRDAAVKGGENLDELKVVNVKDVPVWVYEYEALGQELITCNYENGLGIIKLTFAIDKIPLHRHPSSGRLIRTISGEGYTYVHPDLYNLNEHQFSLFPKNVVHTNGPRPGSVFEVYAYHLPWVPTGIDEEHIAGNESFVKYEGPQLPKLLWRKKEDFYRTITKLTGKNQN
ncbi:hypothetical protein HYZ64_04030 [Candidatus Berkelbacteria bacterium]|nr:hypothetical protein [Candidatus Berkelbacteria bacterium]